MFFAVTGAAAPPTYPDHRVLASPRRQIDLSHGWRFRLGGVGEPIAENVDESGWARVDVPHSWNRVGSYTIIRDPRTDLTKGIGWYRLHFPSPGVRGRHQYLQFDGVGTIAEVWLNGRLLGEHRGAFSRFRFEVTGLLRSSSANLLVVRADNSEGKAGSATGDVIPLSGDFFLFGGLYRGVSLVTTADSHIDMLDHGGPGVYATTEKLTDTQATLAIRTRVAAAKRVTLVMSLDDANGHPVATVSQPVPAGGEPREVITTLVVPSPHRWNGRVDPYRYRLRAELHDGRRLVDRVSLPYGIRTVAFDAGRGFLLNGRPLALHGVSRHQDWLGKGWALDAAHHRADMALAEELGANTIRMAHYQHAAEWFDLADQHGIIVWAELPFVNQVAWTDTDASPSLIANAGEQLTELIRQNYNRPGIVTWSVGNEVDIHARGEKWGNHSLALLRGLAALAKREDPSRATTFADCCEESIEQPLDPKREMLAGATDLIGYNRYFGWYYGAPDQLGPALDTLHRRHPTLPLSVSEYGAGGAISQHSDDPRGGAVAFSGRPQPEEYQAWVLEQSWPQIAARPYVWASWVWNLADFATRTRAEGDATDLNTKGLVTADRKIRKDAFYYVAANWSDAPVLHLTGKRYVNRAYPVFDVRAYSNAPVARLILNAKDIGAAACRARICVWPGVRLAPGSNVATVSAQIGGHTVSDSAQWVAPDPKAGFAIDVGALVGGTIGGRHYGSDVFFSGGEAVTVKSTAPGGDLTARTARRGDFNYRLPLPAGRWEVRANVTGKCELSRDGQALGAAPAVPGQSKTLRFAMRSKGIIDLTFHCPEGLTSLIVEPET